MRHPVGATETAATGLAEPSSRIFWGARTGADVIVCSNAKGLYGSLTASVTEITPDNKLDRAYYGRPVNSRAILMGSVSNSSANSLRQALLTRVATR